MDHDEPTSNPLGQRPFSEYDSPRQRFDVERLEANIGAALFGTEDRPTAVEFGRFVILDRIGAGGMGSVYSAYDPKLDRKVALKVLRPNRVGRTATSELLREAKAVARLSHPNVVTIYDVGEVADEAFIAMELVEGDTLRRWLDGDPARRWRPIVAMFERIGEGLATAHAAGLVHRDFKPENVLVGRDGRPRIIDFGLARATAQPTPDVGADERRRAVDGSSNERTGGLAGTPAYMAPEQFSGDRIDARADQFAFCVAFWEALFGQRPFARDTPAELERAVERDVVAEPKRRDVPRWVTRVLRRGLATDRAQRHPSMDALLGALALEAKRRRRTLAATGAAAILLVGAGAWAGWRVDLERRREQCHDEAAEIDASWDATAKTGLHDALVGTGVAYAEDTYARAVPLFDDYADTWRARYAELCVASTVEHTRAPEEWDAARHCLAERRDELATLLEVLMQTPDASSVARTVPAAAGLARLAQCGDAAWLARNPAPPHATDDATRALRRELSMVRALAATHRFEAGLALAREVTETAKDASARLQSEAFLAAGNLATEAADHEDAEAWLGRSFDIAVAAGSDDIGFDAAVALGGLEGIHRARYDEARLWIRVARALHSREGSDDEIDDAHLESLVGAVANEEGRYAEAARAHGTALAIFERTYGPDHPTVALMHTSLGVDYRALGQYSDAELAHAQALAITLRALGPDHPDASNAHMNLGVVYGVQRRWEEAEREFARALAIDEATFGPNHPDVALGLGNLGNVYQASGRLEEAEDAYGRALAIVERTFGHEHPSVARTSLNLGGIYRADGRLDEAERAIRRALETFERTVGPDHPEMANAHHNLAVVHETRGQLEDAEREYQAAASIWEKAFGPEDPRLAQTLADLAAVRVELGKSRAPRPARAQ